MACEELHTLLSTIFRTYPFWNGSHSHAPEQIGKDNKSIDSKRIQEMQRIIGYLCFTWRTKKQSILMLAKKGIEFNLAKKEEEQRQIFECNMRSLDNENITQSFREKTWDDYHQPRIKLDTDFEVVFVDFFEKANTVDREVIPLLQECLTTVTTYSQKFKVKETTLKVILLIVLNLTLGVMLPLIILNIMVGFNFFINSFEGYNFWLSTFEFLLLMITMSPYFFVCLKMFEKVRSESFM